MEDTTASEAHMDKRCDICGDVGTVYALCTCTQCKISQEHLYCMRTIRFDHPENWHCEECEDLIKASSLNNCGKVQHDSASLNKLSNDLRRNAICREKKMHTGKVKPLSAEEVIMLTTGAKTSGSPVKASFPHTTFRKSRSILKRTHAVIRGIPQKSNSHTRNPYLELGKPLRPPIARQEVALSFAGPRETDATQGPLKKYTQNQEGQPIIAIINNADSKGAQIAEEKATIASTNTLSLKSDQPIVDPGGVVSSDVKIPIAALSLSPLSATTKVDKNLYIPASDASWKGSFNVLLNGSKKWEVSGSIQAHPPSRVRKKVYEASMLIPEVLKFELVQRGSLWTSLFENYTPDSRDIGLYFFPSTCGRCMNYTLLLEHIGEQDMVLRSYKDDLELLVFNSKILQIDCQRWNNMYFLWGLFRRIKLNIITIQAAENHCHDKDVNNKAVDMEIDMIGGQTFGKLDVVVPRIPHQVTLPNHANETFSNIPPGFEKMHQPAGQRYCASTPNHASGTFTDIPPGFEKMHQPTSQRYCASTPKHASGTFSDIPPGFEKRHWPTDQRYRASAGPGGLGAPVKVERLDEIDRKDDSIRTSSMPMAPQACSLDFQQPLKNVKIESP